jgi:hypothetical protein
MISSAVRSHNVPRISKSYESFGDRFATTTIDDLATSDLSQAVKGLSHASILYFQRLNICQVLMPSSMSHPRSPMPVRPKSSSRFVESVPEF